MSHLANSPRRLLPALLLASVATGLLACATPTLAQAAKTSFKFSFGPGKVASGYTQVNADTAYSAERGYGFEPDTAVPAPGVAPMAAVAPTIQGLDRTPASSDPLRSHLVTSDKPFIFSVAVPEGNYKVTVTLGDPQDESTTTVKAEARRLILERIHTSKGEFVTKSFALNVRRPQIATAVGGVGGGGEGGVKLDPREPGSFTWDDKLSLVFCDTRPALCSVEIQKIDNAITVYLCGDSTVTDQPREPYGTWGQMLPRWFGPEVAIANYGESGETVKAFTFEHRWDKVMSLVKSGDYVLMQFGHNDLNKTGRNAMWPADEPSGDWSKTYSEAATDYKRILKEYATQVKQKGAIPVIVSPMTKIQFNTGELNIAGLRDYPQAAVEAAKEAGIACIDLNAMSVELVKALGPDEARKAYVEGLHSNSYGGYLFSRCIVEGFRQNKLDVAKYLVADAGTFDPVHPFPVAAEFKIPLEPGPRGFGGGRGRGPRGTAPATGAASAPTTAPRGN